MNSNNLFRSVRIIFAITSKDIVDALKNKTTLTILLSVMFLAIMYKLLPILESEPIPYVFVHDAGQSIQLQKLVDSDQIIIRIIDDFNRFIEFFRLHADAELGLVFPVDFDQQLANGQIPVIQGYFLHWVNPAQVESQRADVENRISQIVGNPVEISMQNGNLTLLPESGSGYLVSVGIVFILIMLGITLIPNLMLEEKNTKTLDALLVSPASSVHIVISKALTGLFYTLAFVILMLVLNASFISQWWLALSTVALTILISIAIGLLLGTLVNNRQQLLMAANLIILPALLPIFLITVDNLLPGWLIQLVYWLPTVSATSLLRISFSDQLTASSLPWLGSLLIVAVCLLGWETWLVRHSDRQ